MAWKIKFDALALKELKKLEKATRNRIERFVDGLASCENPRSKGLALQGAEFKGLWRYRVGNYRLICQIRDREVVILVLDIGHRKDVYR